MLEESIPGKNKPEKNRLEETKQEETKQEGSKQEETKQEETKPSSVIYVKVNADFTDEGFLFPRSLEWDKTYPISQVTGTRYLDAEEYNSLFPEEAQEKLYIYKYDIKIRGKTTSLYFAHKPASKELCLGRWFILPKTENGKDS